MHPTHILLHASTINSSYHLSRLSLSAACMHKSSSHSSNTWLHALIAFKASHACMIQEVLRKIEWEAQEATRTKPQYGIHLPSSNGYENKGYVDTLEGRLNSKRWNETRGWQVWLWHTWVPWSVDIYVHLHCLRLASEASLTDNSMYLDLIFNLSTVGYRSTWDFMCTWSQVLRIVYCLLSAVIIRTSYLLLLL